MDHFPWSIPPSSRSFWLAFWLEEYMVILEVAYSSISPRMYTSTYLLYHPVSGEILPEKSPDYQVRTVPGYSLLSIRFKI
eukprot:scaffold54421_cov57-Attheya_sp.AAC.1